MMLCRIIDTLLNQKKELFKESGKMEHCLQRLRSYLTTEQTAKFLIIMEKYKSKQELNLFKLWGIKKISNTSTAATNGASRAAIEMILHPHGDHKSCSDDDEGGLPESGGEEEESEGGRKRGGGQH